MPLFGKPKPKQRALTAAGQRIVPETAAMIGARRGDWQRLAWAYRTSVPELRYVGGFVSTQVGRVRWFVAEAGPEGLEPRKLTGRPPEGNEPDTDISIRTQQIAIDALERLDLNSRGSSMAGRGAENFEYAGECYLLGETNQLGQEEWSIRSVSEVKVDRNGQVQLVEPGKNTGRVVDLNEVELFRLWNPDPEYMEWADAKITACLGVLEEIVVYDRQARAAARSRIASGALLYVPEELSLTRPGSAPVDVTAPGVDDEDDLFMAELTAGMLTPISSDEDPSAIVPLVVRGPAMGPEGQPMKNLIGVVQIPREDVTDMISKRDAAVTKLAHGMDFPPEIITGIGDSNHWCVDDTTEVLTTRGWLHQDELRVGDTVLTLNHDSGLSEWQPVQDIYRAHVVNEPMVLMENRTHSSLTTPNHRWPVLHLRGGKNRNLSGSVVDGRRWEREWSTSETLGPRDRIPTAAPCADLPATAKWSDDFVEIVGWYWTEGNARGANVCIAQSHTRNPERVARIRAALTRMYGPPSITLRGNKGPRWREHVQANTNSHGGPITVFYLSKEASAELLEVAPGRHKLVTGEFVRSLTAAQLELFIDISAQGDGQHYRRGSLDMWQRHAETLDGYELALILAGRMTVRGESEGGYRAGVHKATTVNLHKAQDIGPTTTRIEQQRYTGVLWCPTTPNHTWFARRAGRTYFTGNTGWIVSDATIKNHLEPRCENFADALTASYLRETCLAQHCPPEEVARLCVWYDATELSQPADPMGVAKDLWDRDVISDEALARAGGHEVKDMPDIKEKIVRQVTKGRITPQAVPLIVALEAGSSTDPDLARAVHIAEQMAVPTTQLPGPSSRRQIINVGRPSEAQSSPSQPTPQNVIPDTTQNRVPGLTSAAAARSQVEDALSRQLGQVDARAVAELGGFIDAAILDIVRQAANRIRSGAQRKDATPAEKTMFASARGETVDPVAVVAAAGPDYRWTVNDEQALEGALDRIRPQWLKTVTTAAQRVAGVLKRMLGRAPSQDFPALYRTRAEQAWPRLAEQIRRAAVDVLHGRVNHPNASHDDDQPVLPRSVITAALTEVGGLPPDASGIGDDGLLVGGQPATGLAAGQAVLDEVTAAGGAVVSRVWQWDGRPREPFPAHLELDDVEFDGWKDPKLAVKPGDEWIGEFYRPSDHVGCACTTALVITFPGQGAQR